MLIHFEVSCNDPAEILVLGDYGVAFNVFRIRAGTPVRSLPIEDHDTALRLVDHHIACLAPPLQHINSFDQLDVVG